jgi:hypothetical protein
LTAYDWTGHFVFSPPKKTLFFPCILRQLLTPLLGPKALKNGVDASTP